MNSSMTDRRARAPVSRSRAFWAMASRASSSNSRSTSSRARSFWYCLMMALRGSRRIRTSMSVSRPCRVQRMGSLPINSGIMPKRRRSSLVTLSRIFLSSSKASLRTAPKPMEVCFLRRSRTIFSMLGKAPPQIKRILRVLTVARGTMAFLLLAPTGTSTSAPSRSFKSPCWTDSPLTSRELVLRFLAILSISSMKTIPFSAFSTSLSAAARSLEMTLSISSPIYPASVREVASEMASGTSRSSARVRTR